MSEKPQIMFVIGGPGAGKGTHCKIMQTNYGFECFSISGLIRQAIKTFTKEKAQKYEQQMSKGQMVDIRPALELLRKKILDSSKEKKETVSLIDGFPRNFQNKTTWQEVIGDDFQVIRILFLECDQKVQIERIVQRGKTSGRPDDNQQTALKRVAVFNQQTLPVIRQYQQNGKIKIIYASTMGTQQQNTNDIKSKLKQHGILH